MAGEEADVEGGGRAEGNGPGDDAGHRQGLRAGHSRRGFFMGHLSVRLGGGSTVRPPFQFPARRGQGPVQGLAKVWLGPSANPRGSDDNARMRVLLVEDDASIAESLVTGLERERFTVTWVTTGRRLDVEIAAIDLVLLDLGLPDLDGLDVCRECADGATCRSSC